MASSTSARCAGRLPKWGRLLPLAERRPERPCLFVVYSSYIVKRTQIYLDEEQDERLARRAVAEGTTRSALIRRAVDRYLRGERGGSLPLARFKHAVKEAAGAASYLPEGEQYVEEMRQADLLRQRRLEARGRA
jgi:hypothetical protein